MSSTGHLVDMANDIGNFFRAQPHEEAVAGIANHLKAFWSPRMRTKLMLELGREDLDLDALPREALVFLAERPHEKPDHPPGCDAG